MKTKVKKALIPPKVLDLSPAPNFQGWAIDHSTRLQLIADSNKTTFRLVLVGLLVNMTHTASSNHCGDDGFLPPFYSNIDEFFAEHHITYPKREQWRLTERAFGEVHGLAQIRGWLTATNGMLAFVERLDGKVIGPVKLENFKVDKKENDDVKKARKKELKEIKENRSVSEKAADLLRDLGIDIPITLQDLIHAK